MDPATLVAQTLEEETVHQRTLAEAGDPRADVCAWHIQYLENLLGTLDQFPLTADRFVELLRASIAITNPRFPDEPHASVDLLSRWEAGR
ncbi:MAG: hypothetical protein U0556_19680 [Dehalococcoidia bacterium]